MMAPSEPQRLPSRLTPLREVFSRIDALARPVSPRAVELTAAAGRVLAADVLVEAPLPPTAIALRDGWAVRADQVADAGPYLPAALTPPPTLVEVGALGRGRRAAAA
jgi:molybdopterin molybdotransferase